MKLNKNILLLMLSLSSHCYANLIQADTIDNWQIYSDTTLLLASNASVSRHVTTAEIKFAELQTLRIVYNRCVRYDKMPVVLEVTNEAGNIIFIRDYTISSGDQMSVPKEALEYDQQPRSLQIRLWQDKKAGLNVILGRIILQ
jgi:hypothetical protein